MITWPAKDPDETADYAIDFVERLGAAETISSVVWTVPGGLTLASQSNTGSIATARLAGGTLATVYRINCRITSSAGQVLDESAALAIEAR
jgi:hypothetical protein